LDVNRLVSVRIKRNLKSRTKGKGADAQDRDYNAQIIWLSQSPHCARLTMRPSCTTPAPRSAVDDTCWMLLRWMFDAIVDGLALYAASYHSSPTMLAQNRSPGDQAATGSKT